MRADTDSHSRHRGCRWCLHVMSRKDNIVLTGCRYDDGVKTVKVPNLLSRSKPTVSSSSTKLIWVRLSASLGRIHATKVSTTPLACVSVPLVGEYN